MKNYLPVKEVVRKYFAENYNVQGYISCLNQKNADGSISTIAYHESSKKVKVFSWGEWDNGLLDDRYAWAVIAEKMAAEAIWIKENICGNMPPVDVTVYDAVGDTSVTIHDKI